MADQVQPFTISHTGSTLGSGQVTLAQNQVSPQRETPVVTFECPSKYESIRYVGQRDATRFVPRYKETFDGDGSTVDFALTGEIMEVAGESELSEQDYPAVVAAVGGSAVNVASVNYNTNTVTLESAPAAGTDNVQLFPILSEGSLKMAGRNQFNQIEGPVQQWSTPLYRWHDMKQDQRGREINLSGSIRFGRNEKLDVSIDSPRQIVWTDADYPAGAFVSTFEQDVDIEL